ncbi:hypothetical protein L209DRAFT_41956 [Thermothelomyces heterothallicus CBS 203.75]
MLLHNLTLTSSALEPLPWFKCRQGQNLPACRWSPNFYLIRSPWAEVSIEVRLSSASLPPVSNMVAVLCAYCPDLTSRACLGAFRHCQRTAYCVLRTRRLHPLSLWCPICIHAPALTGTTDTLALNIKFRDWLEFNESTATGHAFFRRDEAAEVTWNQGQSVNPPAEMPCPPLLTPASFNRPFLDFAVCTIRRMFIQVHTRRAVAGPVVRSMRYVVRRPDQSEEITRPKLLEEAPRANTLNGRMCAWAPLV